MSPSDPAPPPRDDPSPLTRLADGRTVSTEELVPLVYEDLRRMAAACFRRERAGITLQPTALVNEAYMQLIGRGSWQGRAHFLAIAASAMRHVLLNAARDRRRLKRGGDRERVTLSGHDPIDERDTLDLIDLDEALCKLEQTKARYARIVELRYFAGLSLEETADVLGVSRTIIVREWAKARAWLEEHLGPVE